jgi:hypothetical protein
MSESEMHTTMAANEEVLKVLSTMKGSNLKRANQNFTYSDEDRYEIGKYASLNGDIRAVRKFQSLNPNINESYVRKMRNLYQAATKTSTSEEQNRIKMKKQGRGRTTHLGQWDNVVQEYIRKLRRTGAQVNRHIVLGAARGILLQNQPSLLQNNGGQHILTNSWAKSILRRMRFVKRKGKKAAKKLPPNFPTIKSAFLNRVHACISEFGIPSDLVVNSDETGASYVPVSDWTMDEEGAKQVPLLGLDDKRQMTVFLAISGQGELLPTQMIYAGKTNECHAN